APHRSTAELEDGQRRSETLIGRKVHLDRGVSGRATTGFKNKLCRERNERHGSLHEVGNRTLDTAPVRDTVVGEHGCKSQPSGRVDHESYVDGPLISSTSGEDGLSVPGETQPDVGSVGRVKPGYLFVTRDDVAS